MRNVTIKSEGDSFSLVLAQRTFLVWQSRHNKFRSTAGIPMYRNTSPSSVLHMKEGRNHGTKSTTLSSLTTVSVHGLRLASDCGEKFTFCVWQVWKHKAPLKQDCHDTHTQIFTYITEKKAWCRSWCHVVSAIDVVAECALILVQHEVQNLQNMHTKWVRVLVYY